MTGVALVTATARQIAVEVTDVTMRALSEQQIEDYIATGEPIGKAGAYAIQGRAARFIPRIAGCYFNVVGLPLARVSSMLETIR
jgi:septum formation protein